MIVAKLNTESLLDEFEPFGRTKTNYFDVLGSNPILQIDLVTFSTLIDTNKIIDTVGDRKPNAFEIRMVEWSKVVQMWNGLVFEWSKQDGRHHSKKE